MMEQEKKALYPPCEIGDTVYYIGRSEKEPPFIEEYAVKAVAWNGVSWWVIDEETNIFKIGTDEAILDEGAALARFRELREEYIKNGGKI